MKFARCLAIAVLIWVSQGAQADETQWRISEPNPTVDTRPQELQLEQWNPASSVRKVGGALAVVLGLFFLFTVWMRRPGQNMGANALMHNLGSIPLTSNVRLHLVKVGSRILVLHIAGKSVQRVAEIDNPQEVERILLAAGQSGSSSNALGRLDASSLSSVDELLTATSPLGGKR